jgi:hypothetical protein
MRHDPVHIPPLTDTEPALAERDHMGRRHAATVGEAFSQDWPWVLGVALLLAFIISALAGYWRL